MSDFRLIQISDTHLGRAYPSFTQNFAAVADHIDAIRPDLVVNTGDLAFDGPGHREDLAFARALHAELPVPCRTLPGNHDIGDNPTDVGTAPSQPTTEQNRQAFLSVFGEDRWRFDAAGWSFIGLNSLIMHTGLACEAEQFDWLAAQLAGLNGKPLALFLHKPLFLDRPDDAEIAATSIRYIPMPERTRLIEMLGAVDLRLVASGHVHQRRDYTFGQIRHLWAPSASFIIPDSKQELIGIKEVGLVEYRFRPDAFEVRHVKAPGQIDIDLLSVITM